MLSEHKLAVILSRVSEHPNPKYNLQQSSITPSVAAKVLSLAYSNKDIKNKVVYDLGCGTGRFAIGSALLGAKKVFGVDIDPEALKVAEENARHIEKKTGYIISKNCHWVHADVKKLKVKCDTVVQFPPFVGAEKDIDLIFLKNAFAIAKNVYSVHKPSKEIKEEVKKLSKKHKVKIKKIAYVFLVIGKS